MRDNGIRGLLAAAADLVWPVGCGGCGRQYVRWCADCAVLLAGPAHGTAPSPCPPGLPPTWTTAVYAGPVRRAIVSWKDEERRDLTGPLARALALAVRAALDSAVTPAKAMEPAKAMAPAMAEERASNDDPGAAIVLVPVPSRRAARRSRGADPVRELAVRTTRLLRASSPDQPLPVLAALEHRRRVADQAGLGAQERALNMAGALTVRPRAVHLIRGRRCLLIDDILTTGSTLVAAAQALRDAGAHPFGVAVIAATARETGGG